MLKKDTILVRSITAATEMAEAVKGQLIWDEATRWLGNKYVFGICVGNMWVRIDWWSRPMSSALNDAMDLHAQGATVRRQVVDPFESA